MEQNNFTQQETRFNEEANVFAQDEAIAKKQKKEVEDCAGSAFGKSLASVIIAQLPIGSIIAIILSSLGLKLSAKARALAESYGIEAGGKAIAAKVLGIIGRVLSIVMTVFWGLYFLVLILMFGAVFASVGSF